MWWWLLLVLIAIVIGYGLYRGARKAREMEEDSGYIYTGQRGSYGAKFFKMLGGRKTD